MKISSRFDKPCDQPRTKGRMMMSVEETTTPCAHALFNSSSSWFVSTRNLDCSGFRYMSMSDHDATYPDVRRDDRLA